MLCDEEDLGSWGGWGGWKRKRGERSESEKGRQEGGYGWEDRGPWVYSPQRSEVKAKSVRLRKWVQDGSPLFQHSHHSVSPSLIHVSILHCALSYMLYYLEQWVHYHWNLSVTLIDYPLLFAFINFPVALFWRYMLAHALCTWLLPLPGESSAQPCTKEPCVGHEYWGKVTCWVMHKSTHYLIISPALIGLALTLTWHRTACAAFCMSGAY